jgi:hypothetical protein
MSFFDNLTDEEKKKYEPFGNWNEYYKSMHNEFATKLPHGWKNSMLSVDKKIIREDVKFNETYDCKIAFRDCYFLNFVSFH